MTETRKYVYAQDGGQLTPLPDDAKVVEVEMPSAGDIFDIPENDTFRFYYLYMDQLRFRVVSRKDGSELGDHKVTGFVTVEALGGRLINYAPKPEPVQDSSNGWCHAWRQEPGTVTWTVWGEPRQVSIGRRVWGFGEQEVVEGEPVYYTDPHSRPW